LNIFCFILISLSVYYVYLIYRIYEGWSKTPEIKLSTNNNIGISIIIAARNEGDSIEQCLQSILINDYPDDRYEVIVINDHSTDDTAVKVTNFNDSKIKLISQKEGIMGKKEAISLGISKAKFSVILCTDADCQVAKNWIKSHSELYQNSNLALSTGIVLPGIGNSILDRFQWIDFAAAMAITANGIFRKNYFLANGANLSYTKSTFEHTDGYEGNKHLSSGDDIFLINKAAEIFPNGITFLKSKDTIVVTKAESDWKTFLNQRKRWATKAMKSGTSEVVKIQSFVFIFSSTILVGLILSVAIFHDIWPFVLLALTIKMVTDYIFIHHLANYFNQKSVMWSFLPSFFMYFGHIIISGYFALFPSAFDWKGRKTK